MPSESNLSINGQEITPALIKSDLLDDDKLRIELPNHLVIEEKNVTKWSGDLDDEDCDKLREILRIDTDNLIMKRCRIYVQVIGPAAKR